MATWVSLWGWSSVLLSLAVGMPFSSCNWFRHRILERPTPISICCTFDCAWADAKEVGCWRKSIHRGIHAITNVHVQVPRNELEGARVATGHYLGANPEETMCTVPDVLSPTGLETESGSPTNLLHRDTMSCCFSGDGELSRQAKCGVWNGGWMNSPDFSPWILEFQGLKFLRDSPSSQQNKGFYWQLQALKSKFQGLKFGNSIHHHSIPHLLPLELSTARIVTENAGHLKGCNGVCAN